MADDSFATDSAAFLQWLKTLPGVSINPKIEIRDLRGQGEGRGVVATEDLKEDESLFKIPKTAILSVENSALFREYPHVVRSIEDPWMKLILCLIYESHSTASNFAPYLLIMPSKFDSMMYWTPAELLELQGHPVIEQIGRAQADEVFRHAIAPLIAVEKEIFPSFAGLSGRDLEDRVKEECHRWGSVIMSYAFDVAAEEDLTADPDIDDDEQEGDMAKALIPLADLLNADADLANAHLFSSDSDFEMRAVMPISAGAQILNSYGPLPPGELIRRYGYTTARSRVFDVIEIHPQELIGAAITASCGHEKDVIDRVRSLHQRGLFDEEQPYILSYDPLGKTMPFQMPLIPVAAELLGKDAPKVLRQLLQARLDACATTMEQDEQMLGQISPSLRKGMAVELRLSAKLVMKGAIDVLVAIESGNLADSGVQAVKEELENAAKNAGRATDGREWEEEPGNVEARQLEGRRMDVLKLTGIP